MAVSNPYIKEEEVLAVRAGDSPENAPQGLLACLIQCESGGAEWKINWNDCGSPSYGLLQYKIPTWEKYCVGEIMSGKDQIACAKRMLAMPNGYRHWLNCYNLCSVKSAEKI